MFDRNYPIGIVFSVVMIFVLAFFLITDTTSDAKAAPNNENTKIFASAATRATKEKTDKLPNIIRYTGDDGLYSYVVDGNTGVVYLQYSGTSSHSLTVMLNIDGTPITAKQIGLEY